jgi:spore coat protein H
MDCAAFKILMWAAGALMFTSTIQARILYGRGNPESDAVFQTVVRLELEIPPESLARLRDYKQVWREKRPERVDVPINVRDGTRLYTNVAVHLKGSYSFQGIDNKPSLTLKFDKFVPDQRFRGLNKIHLNNSVQDPTYVCEPFARELFNDLGIPSARAGHALVTLNGRSLGMYVLVEGANKQFVKRHFASTKGNLYDGGSGGDVTKALETDSGDNPDDRSDLTNLVRAAREPAPAKRLERLRDILDIDRFTTFAATEAFIVHWDGYAIGCNNYRVFHDTARDKMVFMPHGLDQLFGISSSPALSITPPFKGMVARALFSVPAARHAYLERLRGLSTNELSASELHRRVERIAARVRGGLAENPRELARFEQAFRGMKQRIDARVRSVEQQLGEPRQPMAFADLKPMPLSGWRYKGSSTHPASSRRSVENNRELLGIVGQGSHSSGAWRKIVLLDRGRYELSGFGRAEGLPPAASPTNGVLVRISGERSVDGISTAAAWTRLSYQFDVLGVEDVELICEFRGSTGSSGVFDAGSLRLTRKGPPEGTVRTAAE